MERKGDILVTSIHLVPEGYGKTNRKNIILFHQRGDPAAVFAYALYLARI